MAPGHSRRYLSAFLHSPPSSSLPHLFSLLASLSLCSPLPSSLFFLNLFIYLFIYLLAMLSPSLCARALSSCGKRGPLSTAVRRPLTVAEHRLQTRRPSSCGPRAQPLRGTRDPPRPGPKPLSPAPAGRPSTTAPPGKPCLPLFFGLCPHSSPLLWGSRKEGGFSKRTIISSFPHLLQPLGEQNKGTYI